MSVIYNDEFLKAANTIKIEVLEAGLADLDRSWRMKDVCSPFSRLYYVISGMGYLCLQDKSKEKSVLHQLRPGFLYMIPNGLSYDYFCEKRLEKVYVHINVLLQNGLELFAGCGDYYRVPMEKETLSSIKNWIQSDCPEHWLRLQGQIYSDVAELVKRAGREEKVKQTYSEMVMELFALLPQTNLATSISQMAQKLNVSESTLAKHFKNETGLSIGRYRELLIMNRARQLLAMNRSSIGEVAEKLGFGDPFYFSKYFRQRQGMTPSAYRRQYNL